jgi:hypothetical protein
MPTLTFPLQPDGLWVPVLLGHDHAALKAKQASGQSVPMPLKCRGFLDTGTDVTGVAPWIITSLGLTSFNKTTTQTASQQVFVTLFEVSLSNYDVNAPAGSSLTRPQGEVLQLPHNLPTVDVLIGLDLIAQIVLHIDGPIQTFSLTW